ncbi:quinoprotein relay system zinc metallohydrolase 1 [Zoogloea sp.]|uniref:quinoprotein relay system zinc metallohydrolase 1 n=1 Tax=Zoogloea sp. TaxID=49181 RepID=UPI0025F9D966|nr:quinoprotein relay system zinc metallohydrolase 1 [Zoogloea sp.]
MFNPSNGGNIVNTGFIVGTEGVVVIDTGPSRRYGEQMRAAIARITPKPIALVINTHHHPDHFLGNQAFAGTPIGALAETGKGIASEGNAFAENLFRMTGDWMSGTEVKAPDQVLLAGPLKAGGRSLLLLALKGHTDADLVVFDEESATLFAGDLVFNQRAPTTPHADIAQWKDALRALDGFMKEHRVRVLVPGHGPIARDALPIAWTRDWLTWLDNRLHESAAEGLDMNETLSRPLPDAYRDTPVSGAEYRRSVGHLFPAAEASSLQHSN